MGAGGGGATGSAGALGLEKHIGGLLLFLFHSVFDLAFEGNEEHFYHVSLPGPAPQHPVGNVDGGILKGIKFIESFYQIRCQNGNLHGFLPICSRGWEKKRGITFL
jgi:hypothetical protein